MRRAALILIVSLGIAVPSEARISPVRGHFGPVMEKASEQETLVARSKRKKKKAAKSTAPSAPSVAAEPVKITTPSVSAGVVQKGRKSQAAYVLDQNSPLDMKLAGAGKLALVFYQVLPAGKVPKGTVEVVVDRGRATKVNLSDRPNRKFSLTGGPKGQVCPPKNHVEQLKAGEHLVSIQTTGGVVAMVRIEFYAGGSKTPAPIELVPPGSGPRRSATCSRIPQSWVDCRLFFTVGVAPTGDPRHGECKDAHLQVVRRRQHRRAQA